VVSSQIARPAAITIDEGMLLRLRLKNMSIKQIIERMKQKPSYFNQDEQVDQYPFMTHL